MTSKRNPHFATLELARLIVVRESDRRTSELAIVDHFGRGLVLYSDFMTEAQLIRDCDRSGIEWHCI